MARRRWNIDTIKQVVEGEQPFPQFGYTGKTGPHKEGDVWYDGKKIKWTIKNGTKTRINDQADLIRDLCKRKCSDCGFDVSMLGNNLDQKTHTKTGKCFECNEKEQMLLMATGQFKTFVQEKRLRTRLSLAKEFKKHTEESIKFIKSDDGKINMVMANGDITTFVGTKGNEFLVEVEKDLEKVNKLIVELEETLSNIPK